MGLTKEHLSQLETPCLVIDVDQVKRNIELMQKAADAAGCRLRPHIKTHKMPYFARMQVEAGAKGITCAKVSEAEIMAEGGLRDIFIAYPMVGAFRVKRAIALHHCVDRLILAVDSLAGAVMLDEMAEKSGVRLEVRLEIDTGAGRTGVSPGEAPALVAALAGMKNLRLTGIYTFKGLVHNGQPTTDNLLAAREEGEMMAAVAKAIHRAGIPLEDISAGSSPTGVEAAKTGQVNEIRPGTYIFKDQLLCDEHVASIPEVAVCYVATVVSTPHKHYAVLDGGSKTFPTDIPLNTPPFFYTGYAIVEGREDLRLSRMNEEHGIVLSTTGETGLRVGEMLTLRPIHVCTAINMQNTVYLLEGGKLRSQKVDARGMLV